MNTQGPSKPESAILITDEQVRNLPKGWCYLYAFHENKRVEVGEALRTGSGRGPQLQHVQEWLAKPGFAWFRRYSWMTYQGMGQGNTSKMRPIQHHLQPAINQNDTEFTVTINSILNLRTHPTVPVGADVIPGVPSYVLGEEVRWPPSQHVPFDARNMQGGLKSIYAWKDKSDSSDFELWRQDTVKVGFPDTPGYIWYPEQPSGSQCVIAGFFNQTGQTWKLNWSNKVATELPHQDYWVRVMEPVKGSVFDMSYRQYQALQQESKRRELGPPVPVELNSLILKEFLSLLGVSHTGTVTHLDVIQALKGRRASYDKLEKQVEELKRHQSDPTECARRARNRVLGDPVVSTRLTLPSTASFDDVMDKTLELLDTAFKTIQELQEPKTASEYCTHTQGVNDPYDYPFIDASRVNRVMPRPPVVTWFATGTTHYRYVWDGCFYPFDGPVLDVPTSDPTWDAGRKHKVPKNTFNLRERDFEIRDGPKLLQGINKNVRKTKSQNTVGDPMSQALQVIAPKFHQEYKMMMGCKEFKPAFRAHRWCSHLARNGYNDDKAHVVGESEHWIITYHPTTLVLWSKECVPYSQHPLPFETITSRYWARTIPDHDHRWASESAEKGYYSHVIKPNEVISPKYHKQVVLYSGRARDWNRNMKACDCKPGIPRFALGNRRLCHRCFEAIAPNFDWPLQKKYHEHAPDLEKLMPYITKEEGQRDVYINQSAVLDIHFSNPAFWFHIGEGPRGRSYGIRVRPHSYMTKRITFPFDVYYSDKTPARDFRDLSFWITRIDEAHKRLPANTELLSETFCIPTQDHLKPYGLTWTGQKIRGFHKSKEPSGVRCVYLHPSQGDRVGTNGEPFWNLYKGRIHQVEFPLSAVQYGHGWHGEYPVFNVNFDHPAVKVTEITEAQMRKLGANVTTTVGQRLKQRRQFKLPSVESLRVVANKMVFLGWLMLLPIAKSAVVAIRYNATRVAPYVSPIVPPSDEWIRVPKADSVFIERAAFAPTFVVKHAFRLTGISVIDEALFYPAVAILVTGFVALWTLWAGFIYYSRNPGIHFPLQENPNGLVTVSETASAPTRGRDVADSMLIVTCGTRGDHVPMMFYARIAATLGIPVHVWNAHLATHEELAALKRGDFTPWLPSWLSLLTSTIQGYKFAFVPHVPVYEKAENYYLGGTAKWVVPTVYGEDYLSKFVTWVSTTFKPHWTIGALSDNNLPRSADGFNPVTRKSPRRDGNGRGKVGWLSGSADEANIPLAIRNSFPKITDPDHMEAFRDYETIYMHGGKGTVDTALACGVDEVVILDQSMDRVYHTMPTPDDVVDHSVLPFIGMLYARGFPLEGKSIWYKGSALVAYYYQQWEKLARAAADTAIRSWIVWQYALSWYNWGIIVILSLPWVLDAFNTKELKTAVRKTTIFLWRYPIFILVPVRFLGIAVFYLVFNSIPKIAGELANLRETKSVMIIKPVAGMPMPFGHVILQCKVTGEVFEGVHLEGQGFDERFKLVTRSALIPGRSRLWRTEHVTHSLVTLILLLFGFLGIMVNFWQPFSIVVAPFWAMFILAAIVLFEGYYRDVPADQPIEIPLPFNTQELREITENARAGSYGPLFNCQTVLLGHVFNHGFFSFYILLLLYFFSLTVMVPGWLATKIANKWSIRICGVDVSAAILRQTRPAAAFAGTLDETPSVAMQVGQAVKSLNVHLAKPAKAIAQVKDWMANNPSQNEQAMQLCTEEDIESANLTPSELETLSRPAWEWTPQAKAIVTKVRNAAIHRISVADEIVVAGKKFVKGTHLHEIQKHLTSVSVPHEQLPVTMEELIVSQDEATQEFESMESIIAQIATLFHLCTSGDHPLEKDAAADIAIKTLTQKISQTSVHFKPLPLPINHPKSPRREWWAKFVDLLHQVLGELRNVEFFGSFFRWLEERQTKIQKYLWDLFDFFLAVAKVLLTVSQKGWSNLWKAINILFDNTMEPMTAKRAKAAWALSGLTEIPRLVAKARLEKSIAMSSYKPRGDFWEDYQKWTDEMNKAALITGMDPTSAQKVGGPMSREVRYRMPVMSRELGQKLEMKEGEEFFVDERLNARTEMYREKGVPLGGDAAFIKSGDYIHRSLHRYTPDFDPTRPSHPQDVLEKDFALAYFRKYPELFQDMKLSSFEEVRRYMFMKTKDRTSPGAGLLGHWARREQAFLAGWDDAMIHLARERLLDGHYPTMFHHGFVKSQVVDIGKVVDQGKNLRTVVAEDLVTYFMNQVIELERNKRKIPGVNIGIGMVLNQNMAGLFQALNDHAKQHGGVLTYADATEYDSKTPPSIWRMLGHLADLGLKDHPSGNGKAMASVLKAKYDALQDSFIFGLTMPNVVNSVALHVEEEIAKQLVATHPSKFIRWQDVYASHSKTIETVADALQSGRINALTVEDEYHKLYANKVLLVDGPFAAYVSQLPRDGKGTERARNLTYAPIYATVKRGDEDRTDRQVSFTTLFRKDPIQFALDLWEHRDTAYNVVHKDQGGGTGENATSWDNSVGFALAYWTGWYHYHQGKYSPEQIIEMHPISNFGDDNIGSNKIKKRDLNLTQLKACMLEAGLNLEIFMVDDIEDMEYLGKIYAPVGRYTPGKSQRTFEAVKFDRETLDAHARALFDFDRQAAKRAGKPLTEVPFPKQPSWLVVQREGDLLMRRQNIRFYQAEKEGSVKISNPLFTGKNSEHGQFLTLRGRQYLAVAIQRSVGHGQLAAFQPQLYRLFGNEYAEDIKDFAAHFATSVTTKWVNDEYGLPYLEVQHNDPKKMIPGSKQWQFAQFLKSNRYPGYMRIVKTHLKPEIVDPFEHDKFMAKLSKSKRPVDDFVRIILDVSKDVIGDMPREIYKMQPSLLALYPDETFYTKNAYVENFILKVHGDKLTSLSQFQALVNQSPYGGCSDAAAAWQAFQEPEYKEKLGKHSVAAFANMCIITTLIYGCLYPFERMVTGVPYVGTAYRLLMFMLVDLPKVYSVLNLVYWHVKAESSKEISAIMPRDPYIQSKRFSAFLADFIPLWIGEYLPFYHAMLFFPEFVEFLSRLIRRSNEIKTGRNERFVNPWDARVRHEGGEFQLAATQTITEDAAEVVRSKDKEAIYRPVIVSSGTGSGKSTLFPYSLLSLGHTVWDRPVQRVVVIAPRKILISQWGSPLDNAHSHYKVQRLSKSVIVDQNARILMGTYGHIVNRIINNEFTDNDIFLMDEFHELSGEMMACVQELYKTKKRMFFLSATPVSLPNVQTVFWNTGFTPRFSKTVYINDDTPVNSFFWGKEQFPEHAKSAIIRVSTFAEVEEVREALSYRNIKTHEVSANTSDKPIPEDDTVLVTTQVIDAGINLPGRRMLVSSGKMLKNIRGEMIRGWTDSHTEKQIEGRVGRFQEGDIVIRPNEAGTGDRPEPYSAPTYFKSELYSRLTGVPMIAERSKAPAGYHYDKEIYGVAFKNGVSEHLKLLVYMILVGCERSTAKQLWEQLYGKGSPVPDHYEMLVNFKAKRNVPYQPYQVALNDLMNNTAKNVMIGFKRLTNDQGLVKAPGSENHVEVDGVKLYELNGFIKPVAKNWIVDQEQKIHTQYVSAKENQGQTPVEVLEGLLKEQSLATIRSIKTLQKAIQKKDFKKANQTVFTWLKSAQDEDKHLATKLPKHELPEGMTFVEEMTNGKNVRLAVLRTPGCPHCDNKITHYHTGLHLDLPKGTWGLRWEPVDMEEIPAPEVVVPVPKANKPMKETPTSRMADLPERPAGFDQWFEQVNRNPNARLPWRFRGGRNPNEQDIQ